RERTIANGHEVTRRVTSCRGATAGVCRECIADTIPRSSNRHQGPPMALLEIRNVTRRFGDFVAVDDVSFSVEAGEFFTLLGPSGCGKTTLLRMIAGFEQPDAGSIVLDGVDL